MPRNGYLNKRIRHGLSKINITIKRGRRYNVVLSSTTGTTYYVTLLLLLCAPAIPWSPATIWFSGRNFITLVVDDYIVSITHFLLANTQHDCKFIFLRKKHDCARQLIFIVVFYVEVHCSILIYVQATNTYLVYTHYLQYLYYIAHKNNIYIICYCNMYL